MSAFEQGDRGWRGRAGLHGTPSTGLPGQVRPLYLLLAAACIPVLLLAGWIAYQSANDQRSAALQNAQETVDRVSERITSEIAVQVQVAETLALSPSLDQPDLADFYREAERLKNARPLWTTIELDDLDGNQLVNLLRPFGSPLGPTADWESFHAVMRDRRPVIGGIGPIGPVSGKQLVALRIPVMRDGTLRFVLTVAMAPDAVSAIVRGAGLPPGWVGAVADRSGKLIARSLAEQATQGRPGGSSLQNAIATSAGGFYNGTTLEGVPVDVVFRTLSDAGAWSVHLGIPSDELNGPTRHALYAVGVGVLVSLALAAALTTIVSRGIAQQQTDDRRRAGAALAASEERAALAVAAADLGTWRWDVPRDRITGSDRFRSLLGLAGTGEAASDWSTEAFLCTVHPGDRDRVRSAIRTCIAEYGIFEANFRTGADPGTPRWLHVRGRAGGVADREPAEIYGIIADIGALKRAETERIDLLRRLSDAQEDVQRRIARDLHDQVGQTVTGLSLGLKGLEQSLDSMDRGMSPAGRPVVEQVRWLQGLTSEIGRDLHRAAADLRPAALDDLGLPRALDVLVADWSDRYGVTTDVQVVGAIEPRLSAEIQTVLYRIVQEALTNVLKHARARNVSIIFERRPQAVHIVIEDDGDGFVDGPDPGPSSVAEAGRRPLGLSGIRERLSMVGGSLKVESSPGAGTTLFVTIGFTAIPSESERA